jgi:hypothetical protein
MVRPLANCSAPKSLYSAFIPAISSTVKAEESEGVYTVATEEDDDEEEDDELVEAVLDELLVLTDLPDFGEQLTKPNTRPAIPSIEVMNLIAIKLCG